MRHGAANEHPTSLAMPEASVGSVDLLLTRRSVCHSSRFSPHSSPRKFLLFTSCPRYLGLGLGLRLGLGFGGWGWDNDEAEGSVGSARVVRGA